MAFQFLMFWMMLGFVCAQSISKDQKVNEIYQQLCASCHGQHSEGGSGGSLADGQWKHGESDHDIAQNIRQGLTQIGMPAFQPPLSNDQIRALVVYIRELEANKQQPKKQEINKNEITRTKQESYKMEMVSENLRDPWALAFLPDGGYLVTEKKGQLIHIQADGKHTVIQGTPEVLAKAQGGLLEVAIHPNYSENGWVYLGFSQPHHEDKQKSLTAVHRGKINNNQWVQQEVIWQGAWEDYGPEGVHFGTRFVFKDGFLFFIVGERKGEEQAQELSNSKGKIFRIYDDGRIPEAHPEFKNKPHQKGIWSFGHRNPQGLAIDPRNGDIWSTEHGPRGGDELNLIDGGKNYGWPIVTHGINYNGTPITSLTEKPGIQKPIYYWVPSIAVCGLDFYSGNPFPSWKNQLLIGSLAGQQVLRFKIENRQVIEQEVIFQNKGRVRDVATGADGLIYIITNNPDRLIRLSPAR